jgi:hypothetical protein
MTDARLGGKFCSSLLPGSVQLFLVPVFANIGTRLFSNMRSILDLL